MEVKNPLFNDDPTPKNPWRHPPGKKQTNQNPWTSPIGERDQKEKRPTRNLMANIDQSYCIQQARSSTNWTKSLFSTEKSYQQRIYWLLSTMQKIYLHILHRTNTYWCIKLRCAWSSWGKEGVKKMFLLGLTYSKSFNYYVMRWKQMYAVFYKGCKIVSGRVY